MQSDGAVLLHPVVEGSGFPGISEEHHGYRLSVVVELQPGGADGGHDRGVGDAGCGDGELARADGEVGVCCCSGGVRLVGSLLGGLGPEWEKGGVPVWIPDDEEGYILRLGAFEDGVTV